MKYNINLDLVKMQEHNLNVNQWCILDIISTASTWCDIVTVGKNHYYWISKNKICEELKALDLKVDTIYRHLKTLNDLGFIEYEKNHKKDLIVLTNLGKSLFFKDENSEINPTKLGNKSEKNSEINPTYNNTNINNNTKDKIDKLFLSYKKENPNASENELKIVEDFILYRKEIKDEIKTLLPIKSYLKSLMELHKLGYKVQDCILKMKENEWKTIKVDYIHKEDKKASNENTAYAGGYR